VTALDHLRETITRRALLWQDRRPLEELAATLEAMRAAGTATEPRLAL
jgi:hypothetical protein